MIFRQYFLPIGKKNTIQKIKDNIVNNILSNDNVI